MEIKEDGRIKVFADCSECGDQGPLYLPADAMIAEGAQFSGECTHCGAPLRFSIALEPAVSEVWLDEERT